MPDPIEVTRTTTRDPAFVALIRELDDELRRTYGEVQAAYAPHNVLVSETAVLASAGGAAIGCGCFVRHDATTIELKRMYVDPARRGTGVGSALVGALEAWAVELGYRAAVLETGTSQLAAIALYQARGYTRIDCYGVYANLPVSLCMRKQLA